MSSIKIPQLPPTAEDLFAQIKRSDWSKIINCQIGATLGGRYRHWDEVRRYRPLPGGLSVEQVWFSMKGARESNRRTLESMRDKQGRAFWFCVPEMIERMTHEIDLDLGGGLGSKEEPSSLNTKERNRYLITGLMNEAITSSQLEGAATTREVAKEMIRAKRKPKDTDEQMILNNFIAMQHIQEIKNKPLSMETLLELHALLTQDTMENPDQVGRFRLPHEDIHVSDEEGTVYHTPPPAVELEQRARAMIAFANREGGETPFIHPILRAIILHFWLAYDHPFCDGNGRTARALFYWSALNSGYWLLEFVSISEFFRKAPAQYARAFLYTESDGNDLTYFIIHHLEAILKALEFLKNDIKHKTQETAQTEAFIKTSQELNHRQRALLSHALHHPGFAYTLASHSRSHDVTPMTARADLLSLHKLKLLTRKKAGKQHHYISPADLLERLEKA